MRDIAPSCGLVIRPGDTLVLLFPAHISVEQGIRIKDKLRERIPGLADVVLIDSATAIAAYRPEAEEGPADA